MSYDDEPPYDPTDDTTPTAQTPEQIAEQAVLGAMLLNPDKTIPTVTSILHPNDYQEPRHETVHNTLVALHTQGAPVDMVTVAQHLANQPTAQRNGTPRTQLDQIGGPLYLHDLEAACPTPAAADHYAGIVRQAARRRTLTNTGLRLTQIGRTGTPDQLDTAYTHAYETLDHAAADFGPTTTPPTTWAPVNLDPVLAGDYLDPPPTMLHRTDGTPLLYDHGVHTISGESESGKTWLCLLAALQLLDQGEHVLFIDFEDRADRVIARLLALGATPTQIRDHFAYIRPDRPLDDTGRAQLTPHLANTRLVILDGVTEAMTLHGYDLNSNEHSAQFQALLPRWIADHGPAVASIDHVVKDKEKQDRHAIGAQHKLAGIDGAAYMVKTIQPFARGRRGIAQIIIAKDRPGYIREQAFGKVIAEFALDGTISDTTVIAELTPPGELSGRKGDTWEPTYLMEKISRYVEGNPGLSKKAIEDMVNGRLATRRLALELLVTRGYIGTKQEARGRVAHFHTKPYRETDQTDTSRESDTEPDNGEQP